MNDNNSVWTTTTGTGVTLSPNTWTTSYTMQEFVQKSQLDAWMKLLIERIEQLQDKVRKLEGASYG